MCWLQYLQTTNYHYHFHHTPTPFCLPYNGHKVFKSLLLSVHACRVEYLQPCFDWSPFSDTPSKNYLPLCALFPLFQRKVSATRIPTGKSNRIEGPCSRVCPLPDLVHARQLTTQYEESLCLTRPSPLGSMFSKTWNTLPRILSPTPHCTAGQRGDTR